MADYEDKLIGPVFPTRSGTAPGGSTERQMLDATQGASGIRTKLRSHPEDGSTTLLKTRGGHPHFYTDKKEDPSVSVFLGGLSATAFIDEEQDGKTSIFRLRSRNGVLSVGKKTPHVPEIYSFAAGYCGGYSYLSGDTLKARWVSGAYKISGSLLVWNTEKTTTVKTHAQDGHYLPFSTSNKGSGFGGYVVSDTALSDKNGVLFSYTVKQRQVYIDAGLRNYTTLPPQVTLYGSKILLQSFDGQTFKDRPPPGVAVITDLTKYYQSIVYDVVGGSVVSDESLELAVADRNITETGGLKTDADEIASVYSTVCYEPQGLADGWEVMTGSDGVVDHAYRADFEMRRTATMPYSMAFAKTVVDNQVVDVEYRVRQNYDLNIDIRQRWVVTGPPPLVNYFVERMSFDGSVPFYYQSGKDSHDLYIHVDEQLNNFEALVKIGEIEFPFFSAKGESYCSADARFEQVTEHVHGSGTDNARWNTLLYDPPPPAVPATETFGSALEDVMGHSQADVNSWPLGWPGRARTIIGTDSATPDRVERVKFDAKGSFFLAADAALGFSAYIECRFKYDFTLSSAAYNPRRLWLLPQIPPEKDIECTVFFVVRYKGNEYKKEIVSTTLVDVPPVRSVAHPNPYYFVELSRGVAGDDERAEDADVCWTHYLPTFEPQPSFFESVDVIVNGQGSCHNLAGISDFELAEAVSNNPAFSNTDTTVIFSKTINLHEAGADWLFVRFGLDKSVDGVKYGKNIALHNALCESTFRLEFDSVNLINLWVDNLSQLNGEKHAKCHRV